MEVPLQAIEKYLREAETEDLLDRVTVFRELTELEALKQMLAELKQRGLTEFQIAQHDRERRKTAILGTDGLVLRCHLCRNPAIDWRWVWHRLFGRVPIFPRRMRVCASHGGQVETLAAGNTPE